MTSIEINAVIAAAGGEAAYLFDPQMWSSRDRVAIHEAAHCVVALRLGREPQRVLLEPDGSGLTIFVEGASRSEIPSDDQRLTTLSALMMPNATELERWLWELEMRRRASGLVKKHLLHILALAEALAGKGELTRAEIRASGPPWPRLAGGVPVPPCS